MIDGPYFVLTVLGVLGTGLVAGVFCGFDASSCEAWPRCRPRRGSPR
ncbi:membrane protein [Streptomyces purpurascens]